jgi:peptidoglycan-N-acetylglucosamine deacetylase
VRRFAILGMTLLIAASWYSFGVSQSRTKSIKKDVQQAQKVRKEIAITFDDFPYADGSASFDRRGLVHSVIDVLNKHHVRAVGFTVGNKVIGAQDILGEWLNVGHGLGNLSYSNHDISDLSGEQFIAEIRRGAEVLEPMLDGFGQQRRYFRYPSLSYGSSKKLRGEVQGYLTESNTVVAHASVVVDDSADKWGLGRLGDKADSVDFRKVGTKYVAHVMSRVLAAEKSSQKLLQRQCRQILRLQMNRLNAALLDDVLSALEAAGYRFVTLDAALADPVYQKAEANLGTRGVSYLDMIAESDPDPLPGEEKK